MKHLSGCFFCVLILEVLIVCYICKFISKFISLKIIYICKMIHERIKQVIELSGLTMTEFADLLKVQRSSISHLISGRNKPSMDFLEKLVEHFPSIDLKWLISGGSSLPVEVESSTTQKQEKKIKQIIVWYSDNSFEIIKELG